jgi:hypothetical protein
MRQLTGISPLRFWWIGRRFGVRDGTAADDVRLKLGAPVEREVTDDGEWWRYPIHRGREYDISYSILINAGAVITSVWGSSLRGGSG